MGRRSRAASREKPKAWCGASRGPSPWRCWTTTMTRIATMRRRSIDPMGLSGVFLPKVLERHETRAGEHSIDHQNMYMLECSQSEVKRHCTVTRLLCGCTAARRSSVDVYSTNLGMIPLLAALWNVIDV